jgi:hypothetical protein
LDAFARSLFESLFAIVGVIDRIVLIQGRACALRAISLNSSFALAR